MRQVGVLAAAGLFALEHNFPKLKRDHDIAWRIGQAVNSAGQQKFKVDRTHITSNLVFVCIDPKVTNATQMVERLQRVSYFRICVDFSATLCHYLFYFQAPESEENDLGGRFVVLSQVFTSTNVRLAIHLDITDEMAKLIVKKVVYVINEFLAKM